MKKKLLAALLAAAMLTGLASATFAANEDVTDTTKIETVTITTTPTIKAGETITLEADVTGQKWVQDTTVTAMTKDDVIFHWSADKIAGVTVTEDGKLTVAADAKVMTFAVMVTATYRQDSSVSKESERVTFTVTGIPTQPYATKIEITGTPDKVTPGSEFTLKAVATMSQESASYDGGCYHRPNRQGYHCFFCPCRHYGSNCSRGLWPEGHFCTGGCTGLEHCCY